MLRFMAYHRAHMDLIVFTQHGAFADVGALQDRRAVPDRHAFFNGGVGAYFDTTANLAFWIN